MSKNKSIWDYKSNEQQKMMEEPLTVHNCGSKLKIVREITGMSRKDLALTLGCSESTISRLESGKTNATGEFMGRLNALAVIGHEKFSKLGDEERSDLKSILGVTTGGITGIAASIGATSATGSVAGLSATGITSGLAALGAGGGMLAGVGVVAAIPVAAALAGYGVVKGIEAICEANDLTVEKVDDRFELKVDTNKVKK